MPRKPNYQFEKRQKELERKARKEEKARRREERSSEPESANDPATQPAESDATRA